MGSTSHVANRVLELLIRVDYFFLGEGVVRQGQGESTAFVAHDMIILCY